MPNLYEQLQEKLEGHTYNDYFAVCCVFHSEKNPSMFVYESGNFRCASCNKHGSLEYLWKYLGGRDVKVAKSKPVVLPRWSNWEAKWGDLQGIADHAHKSCKVFPQYMWYFKQRKIESFFEQGYFGYIDGWCLFPVFDDKHKIQNIVARQTNKKVNSRYVNSPLVEEKKPLLYIPNWQRVNSSDVVYVVYGIIDAISLELAGLPVVTGCTGKSLSPELLKPLGKEFIILPDEGEEREAHNLANSLGWRGSVKRLKYPENTKDLDEVRRGFGNEILLQMVGA